MYRIRTSRYPDGSPYIRVELPPLSDPQLDLLESVVSAIWRIVAPQAGPALVWLPAQSSTPAGPEREAEPSTQKESPGA